MVSMKDNTPIAPVIAVIPVAAVRRLSQRLTAKCNYPNGDPPHQLAFLLHVDTYWKKPVDF
jgi:hypothetical protein